MQDSVQEGRFELLINKLKARGISGEEILTLFTRMANNSGLILYEIILMTFNDEEIGIIENINDDEEAKSAIEKVFEFKNGFSVENLLDEIHSYIAEVVSN